MNNNYIKIKLAGRVYNQQDKAYAKLTQTAAKAAATPAKSRSDRLIRLTNVSVLNSVRRYQFFRPYQKTFSAAFTADTVVRAVRASRDLRLLPLGTPFLLGTMALYTLLGTGEKARWVSPDSHPLVMAAAVLTRSGVLGLPCVLALSAGNMLDKAGYRSLAQAAYAIATCFSCAVEPLRAALACASFVLQVPYTLAGIALDLGITGIRAARAGSLSPRYSVWDAGDLFPHGCKANRTKRTPPAK